MTSGLTIQSLSPMIEVISLVTFHKTGCLTWVITYTGNYTRCTNMWQKPFCFLMLGLWGLGLTGISTAGLQLYNPAVFTIVPSQQRGRRRNRAHAQLQLWLCIIQAENENAFAQTFRIQPKLDGSDRILPQNPPKWPVHANAILASDWTIGASGFLRR